ncbi:hypothetical protein [Arthrobacter methylotrophus]|uniref:hypothetical protein n=1 Tax=Arthrobacter methylotrophus TaxID=121291 RepID=UPI0031EC9805
MGKQFRIGSRGSGGGNVDGQQWIWVAAVIVGAIILAAVMVFGHQMNLPADRRTRRTGRGKSHGPRPRHTKRTTSGQRTSEQEHPSAARPGMPDASISDQRDYRHDDERRGD